MKKIALFLPFLLLLGGCASRQPDTGTVREHFDELSGFTAHVKIFSNLGDSALEYELDYAYNREGSDRLTLTAPEAVAGIEAVIDGEDSFLLRYNGAELDDGMPPLHGVTPADSVYWLLRELRESEPLELWNETVSDVPALALRYESSVEETTILRQVWLSSDGLIPLCAEIYADGNRALLLTFSDYHEGAAAAPEPETPSEAPPEAETPAEAGTPPESAVPSE